ncbi:hypothetical protein JL720_5037 [Aureococcus anophagefferens]|nr:hypothetical protein JL720_5037 [Aureococcus anophagefferens]
MVIDAGDDEGAGDCFIDATDRILHVAKWKANGDEAAFAAPMEKLWETFEADAPGWKWIAVARDGPTWLAVMLFSTDSDAVAYSEILAQAPALAQGHVVYDDAVPIRKKVAAKALPPGALLWLYCVEVDKKDALAEFEEQLIRKLDKSIFGFAVTKPFQGGKRLSFSAIAATKADLEAYRTRVLNPLLKTIPVKTVPYDDIAPICGYNDAEPRGRRLRHLVKVRRTSKGLSVVLPIASPDWTIADTECFFEPRTDAAAELLAIDVPVPCGVILEERDDKNGAPIIVVGAVGEGSNAEAAGVLPGDILRATTAVKQQMEMPTWQLLGGGIGRPRLFRFVFGADLDARPPRTFEEVRGAVASNRMDQERRPAILVVERPAAP